MISVNTISHKCLDYASEILKFSSFKELKTKAILSALNGRDVFVNLRTGYGKSGIYEAIPLCYDYLRNEEAGGTLVTCGVVPGARGTLTATAAARSAAAAPLSHRDRMSV